MEQIMHDCNDLYAENNRIQGALNNELNELHNIAELGDFNGNSASRQQLKNLERSVAARWATLIAKRSEYSNNINQGTEHLLQDKLNAINCLNFWKTKQKHAQIGAPFDEKHTELASIDAKFGKLFDNTLELRKLANWLIGMLMEPLGRQEDVQASIANLTNVIAQLDDIFQTLLQHILVVVQQPDPVLKTQRKINQLEVHILAADKLGIKQKFDNANIHVKLIPDELARQLASGDGVKNTEEIGKISNAKQKSMPNKSQHMTVKFSSCMLMSVERRANSKKELKYALLFYCDPLLLENFGEVNLWVLSLPVMVAVHGSQDCELYAAIFWQRAFGFVDYVLPKPRGGRKGTTHPHKREDVDDESLTVPWPHLAQAIMYQFKSFTGAERPLTHVDVDYVAEKMFGPAPFDDPVRQNTFVTHRRYQKESMNNEVDFSCWDWFFAIMQLIKQREILDMWNKGCLIGFISKNEAAEKMNAFSFQTFLLRFSDRMKGAISIAYILDSVCADGRPERQAFHLNPLVINDLQKLSLVERIEGLNEIQYLYSDRQIDKERLIDKENIINEEQLIIDNEYIIDKKHIIAHFAKNDINPSKAVPLGYMKAKIHVIVGSTAAASRESSPSTIGRLCHASYPVPSISSDMEMEDSYTDNYYSGDDQTYEFVNAQEEFSCPSTYDFSANSQLPAISSIFAKQY